MLAPTDNFGLPSDVNVSAHETSFPWLTRIDNVVGSRSGEWRRDRVNLKCVNQWLGSSSDESACRATNAPHMSSNARWMAFES
jgi:hypothetical protein